MRAGDAWLLIAERDGSPFGFAFFRICDGDWSFETNEGDRWARERTSSSNLGVAAVR
jgi:hypothetical protein